MRIGLLQTGTCLPGVTVNQRYHEMIDELILADELGFDVAGTSEQHFGLFNASTSSPEVYYAHAAARTQRIHLRWMIAVLLKFNHPIRLAEQLMLLDVLSRGRAEMACGRSNSPDTMAAFGVKPTETMFQRDEGLEVLARAVTQEEFEYHGEMYDIPPVKVRPRGFQKPFPAISLGATGIASHAHAGRKGIPVMSGNTIGGWDYVAECIESYNQNLLHAEPLLGAVYADKSAISLVSYCAPTMDKAKEVAGEAVLKFFAFQAERYGQLSATSDDYAYLTKIFRHDDHRNDLEYLMDCAPYFTIGTPDYILRRFERLHEIGYDEFVLRIDGMGHDNIMNAIELAGREIVPVVHKMSGHRESQLATQRATAAVQPE